MRDLTEVMRSGLRGGACVALLSEFDNTENRAVPTGSPASPSGPLRPFGDVSPPSGAAAIVDAETDVRRQAADQYERLEERAAVAELQAEIEILARYRSELLLG